jgi:hypothetical protein
MANKRKPLNLKKYKYVTEYLQDVDKEKKGIPTRGRMPKLERSLVTKKRSGGSMKKGLKATKASAEKREPKVKKQRKKSKGGLGYTVMGTAAGAIPFVGTASKAIPAIAKGVKTIKAGMKASKAKNPKGVIKKINPKSSAKTTKPSNNRSQAYDFRDHPGAGDDVKLSTLKEPIMIRFKKDGKGLRKAVSKKSKNTVKKNMGGSLKAVNNPGLAKLPTPVRNKMGYAKGGGKVEYKKHGGKVIKTNMSGDDLVRGCYD